MPTKHSWWPSHYNNVGCSASLKTSFELNPVIKDTKLTFTFLFNFSPCTVSFLYHSTLNPCTVLHIQFILPQFHTPNLSPCNVMTSLALE